MLKPTLYVLMTFALSSICTTAFAQDKLWEVDLTEQLNNVSWILQSNDGLIIAAGDKGLLAMDNNNGKVAWQNKELKAVNKNSFLNVEGLPLFYVEYQPLVGKTRGLLINSSNGDVVFDTKDEGYLIKTFTLLPEQAAILFEMTQGTLRKLMKFSLKTWEQEWIADLGEAKGTIGKLVDRFDSVTFIDHGPLFTTDNHMIVGIDKQIFGINFATGGLDWNMETDKAIKALVYSDLNDKLYLGIRKSSKLTVLNPSNGADVTPGKLKLRGTLLDVRPDANNNLVLVETEGFNLINPTTEDFVWSKSFKIDYLDEVIPYKDKYIAIGKDEKNGSISLVDASGKKIWDAKVKGYSYYTTPTPKGVMYISTERSNIFDFADGKDVWDKDVKFKSIPAVTYDEAESKVVIFENEKGYKFNLETGKIELFAEDIELVKVDKKTPLVADYVPEGYFIHTDQHASLLSPAGKLIYTKYYEPVSSTDALMKVAQLGLNIAGADIDIAGSMDNMKALSSLANGSYRSGGDQNGATTKSTTSGLYVGNAAGTMTPVFEVTTKRFFNSKQTKGHQFMTVNEKVDGAASRNFIFRLNKGTGKVDLQIELMDKTPNYFIDEVDNRVFINEKNHLISSYQM